GGGILRVAEGVLPHLCDEGIGELCKQRARNVDSLHSATALARIVEGAVHQVRYREIEIGVLANQRRIFSAEFQTHIKQLSRCFAVDLPASLDRTGERDEINGAPGNQARDRLMTNVNRRNEFARQLRLAESVDERVPT